MVGDDRVGAVLVAAGQSRRFGRDKLSELLLGEPVLAWSLHALDQCQPVDEIALVTSSHAMATCAELVAKSACRKRVSIVCGGARRQDSVLCGLRALTPCRWVLVHDAARPLLTSAIIDAGLWAVRLTGAAVPGIPLRDTVKRVDGDDIVTDTPERAHLRAIQTPQVFDYDLLMRAHQTVTLDVTDDGAMIEALGGRVVVFPGDPANIKVTTTEDIDICEALLRARRR